MPDPTTLRYRITRIIAATRFPFVDQDSWGAKHQTIVNDEVKRFAVQTSVGVLYPSIIITNDDGSIREIGVIEGAEEITKESIPRWKALSEAAPFGREFKKLFLYVVTI